MVKPATPQPNLDGLETGPPPPNHFAFQEDYPPPPPGPAIQPPAPAAPRVFQVTALTRAERATLGRAAGLAPALREIGLEPLADRLDGLDCCTMWGAHKRGGAPAQYHICSDAPTAKKSKSHRRMACKECAEAWAESHGRRLPPIPVNGFYPGPQEVKP